MEVHAQESALGEFRHAKRLHPFGVAEFFARQNSPTQILVYVHLYSLIFWRKETA